MRWCYEGLLINEIADENFRCSADEAYPFEGTAPGFTGKRIISIYFNKDKEFYVVLFDCGKLCVILQMEINLLNQLDSELIFGGDG